MTDPKFALPRLLEDAERDLDIARTRNEHSDVVEATQRICLIRQTSALVAIARALGRAYPD